MGQQSYAEFRSELRSEVWPSPPGEPRNLRAAHDKFFLEAMVEAQKWVHCLRENNTTVIPACSSYVECAKSIADFPPTGAIKRVYTIANNEFCDLIHLQQEGYNELNCRAKNLCRVWTPPANIGLPALQQGVKFADKTTDIAGGRARTGVWAYWRGRLYVYPWIQSNESIVIEWDGWKTSWEDSDILDTDIWGPDAKAFVKLYVQECHLRDYDCDREKLAIIRGSKAERLADLMYWCRERTSVQAGFECEDARFPTKAETEDDAVPTTDPMVFAVIGDFGSDNVSEGQVASMVRSWAPQFIVTVGDNWYGTTNTPQDIDLKIGKYYHDFLYPYGGGYGPGASEQKMFAAIGNHDRDPVGRLAIHNAFFNLPSNYYDFIKGHVHFFMLDAGFDNSQVNQEADGNTANSIQGQWLKTRSMLSVAKWKVAIMHQQPYSSTVTGVDDGELVAGDHLQYPSLQWPFKQWGLNVMFNGHSHNYERLQDDKGFTYICSGFGGVALKPFAGEPNPFSLVRDASQFGAVRCEVTCNYFKIQAFNIDGTLLDTVVFGTIPEGTPDSVIVVDPVVDPEGAGDPLILIT